MIIVIAPGLILFCVAIVALIALSHLTAGALIAMVAIMAGCALLSVIAYSVIKARLTPGLSRDFEAVQSRLTAQSIVTPDGIWQLPPQPEWHAEPILDPSEPLTPAQLEAAFRYMAKVYGEPELNQLSRGTDAYWRDASQADLEGMDVNGKEEPHDR